MSSTTGVGLAAEPQELSGVDMKLEVVSVPVSDVERAKSFYQGLGWRLDADISPRDDIRVVQFTPPHSQCSVGLERGLTAAEPGSVQRLEIVVSDMDAAREDLISRGVDVSEPFHNGPSGVEPGPDPNHMSYNTYATFSDPDGNSWLLQEVTTRLPGREWED